MRHACLRIYLGLIGHLHLDSGDLDIIFLAEFKSSDNERAKNSLSNRCINRHHDVGDAHCRCLGLE